MIQCTKDCFLVITMERDHTVIDLYAQGLPLCPPDTQRRVYNLNAGDKVEFTQVSAAGVRPERFMLDNYPAYFAPLEKVPAEIIH